MKLQPLLLLLLIISPNFSQANPLNPIFELFGINRKSTEEKVITSVKSDLDNNDPKKAAATLIRYQEKKIRDYKNGDKPQQSESTYFYLTHWDNLLATIIRDTPESQVEQSYELIGELFASSDQDHLFALDDRLNHLYHDLSETVKNKREVKKTLTHFQTLYKALSPEAKPVAAYSMMLWVTNSNKAWDEREWAQAQQWLNTHTDPNDLFTKAIKAGLSARVLVAHKIRKQPYVEPNRLKEYEKTFLNVFSDETIHPQLRLAGAALMLRSAWGAINCPQFTDLYIELVSSEEDRGMPPAGLAWWELTRAAAYAGDNEDRIKSFTPSLAKTFHRARQGGDTYPPIQIAAHQFRCYLQVMATDSDNATARQLADFWYDDSTMKGSMDIALALLDNGIYDLAQKVLPDETANFKTNTRMSSRPAYNTSERLFNNLDTFHEKIANPLQSIHIELATTGKGINPRETYSVAEAPLNNRLDQFLDLFQRIDTSPAASRAAIMAQFEGAMSIPKEILTKNVYNQSVYSEIPLGSQANDTAKSARASYLALAFHYQDREMWRSLLEDVAKEDFDALWQTNVRLCVTIFNDIIEDRISDYEVKAEMLTDYCQVALTRDNVYYPLEQQITVDLARFSSELAGIALDRSKIYKDVPKENQKAANKSFTHGSPMFRVINYVKLYSRHFRDFPVRQDMTRRLLVNLHNHKPYMQANVTQSHFGYSITPYLITEAEKQLFLSDKQVPVITKATLALGALNGARFKNWNSDRLKDAHIILDQLPETNDYSQIREAIILSIAESEKRHGNRNKAREIANSTNWSNHKDISRRVKQLKQNL